MYKEGEYIVYVNGGVEGRYEIGRVKKVVEDGAFVCYHEGETAAKTPFDTMHKLVNEFTVKHTTLGGEVFKENVELEPGLLSRLEHAEMMDSYLTLTNDEVKYLTNLLHVLGIKEV